MTYPENEHSNMRADGFGYYSTNDSNVGWHLSPSEEPFQPINPEKGPRIAMFDSSLITAPNFYTEPAGVKVEK